MKEKELTTKEVALKFGVKQVTVRAWCERGDLPNARKETSVRGDYWVVPESDLKDFAPHTKRGRPRKAKEEKEVTSEEKS